MGPRTGVEVHTGFFPLAFFLFSSERFARRKWTTDEDRGNGER